MSDEQHKQRKQNVQDATSLPIRHLPTPTLTPTQANKTLTGNASLSFNSVSFSYGRHPFIKDFNLQLRTGCITGIVGPNGCGKSTLLKLACGILKPQTGEVLINKRATLSLKAKERARLLAYLTQSSAIPTMTVEDLVACGRFPYHSHQGGYDDNDHELINKALKRANIEHLRTSDLHQLSGGERQRALIAMTLAQDTNIITLDEPTTYLDVHACHEIMSLLQKLNRHDNTTIIVVIHDIDLALRYCDRIAVLKHGRLLGDGSVNEVLSGGFIEEAFNIKLLANSTDLPSYSLFPN